MRNKIFTKIIITTLLVTFLTLNVGRVTRVSAIGTTAVIAGTAFILTGAVYMSYIALTQGEMILPAAEELHDWLGGIGRKVSQYPSGAATYQELYQNLAREPVTGIISDVWSWTEEKLKSFANDFSDTRIISSITGYYQPVDVATTALNGFIYDKPVYALENTIGSSRTPFTYYTNQGFEVELYSSTRFIYNNASNYVMYPCNVSGQLRSRYSNGYYYSEIFNGSSWVALTYFPVGGALKYDGVVSTYLAPMADRLNYEMYNSSSPFALVFTGGLTVPVLADAPIYDEDTDSYRPLTVLDPTFQAPTWVDPDNENRPIIPWVPIPDLPTGVPVPPGYNIPKWGFPLQDLLDLLESLAESLMEIGAIEELINRFAGQHGDEYYLYYTEGDTNYYYYYQPTNYDNDTEYVTYNINVSEEEDVIPVDLNTISLYTQNRYLDQIKESAIEGSSMLRDFAVFWHDVDPEITYIVLGCCILVLIGAFTGKLGHS